jgi:hypothetical protein
MMTLTKCKVSDSEGGVELRGAVVVVSGESPNSTVRISQPDPEMRKFRPFDRILNATVTGAGRNWTIQGVSEHLRSEVQTSEAEITYRIVSTGGCQGCR